MKKRFSSVALASIFVIVSACGTEGPTASELNATGEYPGCGYESIGSYITKRVIFRTADSVIDRLKLDVLQLTELNECLNSEAYDKELRRASGITIGKARAIQKRVKADLSDAGSLLIEPKQFPDCGHYVIRDWLRGKIRGTAKGTLKFISMDVAELNAVKACFASDAYAEKLERRGPTFQRRVGMMQSAVDELIAEANQNN